MTTKMLNFRVSEEEALRIEREAKRVPYRTVSQYLREIVAKALPKPKRKSAQGNPGGGSD